VQQQQRTYDAYHPVAHTRASFLCWCIGRNLSKMVRRKWRKGNDENQRKMPMERASCQSVKRFFLWHTMREMGNDAPCQHAFLLPVTDLPFLEYVY
jgi:hypothetical protein